jgi:sialate O-acetylesterase
MAPLFTDSMVVQQRSTVPVWGKGTPGARVVIHASWKTDASTAVTPDGNWSTAIATPRAGGPYTIRVQTDDSTLTLMNVLVGEVWLCSGQSNMEMPLQGWPPDTILSSQDAIDHSTYPSIRLFTVKHAYSTVPEEACAGRWTGCSPGTTPLFSAAAYFFGRNLSEALKVPIGLIHASWGGTKVEAWMGSGTLARVAQYDSVLQKIRITEDSMKVLESWLERFPVIEMGKRDPRTRWQNLDLGDGECSSPGFNDSSWRTMHLPAYWETTGVGEFDGVVWFRHRIALPPAWVHRNLVVELGPVDDMDITYVNGREVGSHESEGAWNAARVYPVPKETVDTTSISIAVRVIDNGGGGGLYGPATLMRIHPEGDDESISLAGDWKYLPVADYRLDRLHVFGWRGQRFFERPSLPFDFSGYSPTALFNGMIAPLAPFSLAGVIWYQGESNAGAPLLYRTLFPLMIGDWRSVFHSDALPFYYVQIAPYEYGPGTNSAYLREAQLLSLGVKNTGMAVTLDVGSARTIHPPNKQEVGRRLALVALAKTYGKKIVSSGPLYHSKISVGDRIELVFGDAGRGLVLTQSERGNGFQVAGEDRVFRNADVAVRGSRLLVSSPQVKRPVAVRYAFGNVSQATLYNSEGLPASSFRTDDWVP